MERSTSLSREEESPGTARQINGFFRNQAGSFFRSTSRIGAPNTRSTSSSKIRAPRIGLCMFSGERTERLRPLQSDYAARYRRPPPVGPSSIELAEAGLSGPHVQVQGRQNSSHRSRLQTSAGVTLANSGAQARRKHADESKRERFCGGPRMRSKEARKKVVDCALAGFLLMIIFVIYLALSLSNTIDKREFHIVFILALIILVIYFCHSFIRFFMLAWRSPPAHPPSAAPKAVSTREYVQPDQPIPVILARDEEIVAEVDADNHIGRNGNLSGLPPPPPAYGLWRNSVRINPNLVHWRRREPTGPQPGNTESEGLNNGPHRPPSYISDDGVHYVVDIQPQSRLRAPDESDVHPAERLGQKQ
ncbi:hypothetical protein BDBG_04000 [Blastomyces gilchristii SLH14081]|uniref:Uncharacterized protein n=1 Tax=Blastomyces gilchristii (strain SLH14081) TaxID=559298 RepID=A0A179UJ07_BLAGS|nr:uncharacterized protein BDBG_04000 [Blastomyces gilchristii SLH14081]OAT08005.1 hypothetical protein BDBG_04000 [Blastomyces gilchristii SLH14081]